MSQRLRVVRGAVDPPPLAEPLVEEEALLMSDTQAAIQRLREHLSEPDPEQADWVVRVIRSDLTAALDALDAAQLAQQQADARERKDVAWLLADHAALAERVRALEGPARVAFDLWNIGNDGEFVDDQGKPWIWPPRDSPPHWLQNEEWEAAMLAVGKALATATPRDPDAPTPALATLDAERGTRSGGRHDALASPLACAAWPAPGVLLLPATLPPLEQAHRPSGRLPRRRTQARPMGHANLPT